MLVDRQSSYQDSFKQEYIAFVHIYSNPFTSVEVKEKNHKDYLKEILKTESTTNNKHIRVAKWEHFRIQLFAICLVIPMCSKLLVIFPFQNTNPSYIVFHKINAFMLFTYTIFTY